MNKLKEYRLAMGLTQPQVVAELRHADPRVDVPMLSKIESGVCLPNARVLSALETILQVSRSELFSKEDTDVVEQLEGLTAPQDSSSLISILEKLIPFGHDNAVRRDDLAFQLGVSDRAMRNAIEIARGAGMLINNDGDGRGYYRPNGVEALIRQYRQDKRRALSILYRCKTERRTLKEAGVDVNQL